jgi:hypothetical protein
MPKINPKSLKIGEAVCIHWEDAYGCSPVWENWPSSKHTIAGMMCRSVGWVASKTKGFVLIVPHVADNSTLGVKQACGDMAIPLTAIRRVKRLHLNG